MPTVASRREENSPFIGRISKCFEDHLGVYISAQERFALWTQAHYLYCLWLHMLFCDSVHVYHCLLYILTMLSLV